MSAPRSPWKAALTAAALLAAAGAGPLAAGELLWSSSVSWATGDYTLSEETSTAVLLTGLSWRQGRWRLAGSVPLIHQDTPFVAHSGGVPIPVGRHHGSEEPPGTMGGGMSGSHHGGVPVPDPDTLDFDETGVGDPLLRADVRLTGDGAPTRFGLWAAVKPPIADETSGFGTGELDAGGGVTFGRRAGRGLWLGELGAWVLGDPPDFELEDPFSWALSYGHPVGDRGSLLVGVAGWTETVDGADGPAWASLSGGRRLRGGGLVTLTGTAGLSETAADWSLALGWSVPVGSGS